MVRRLILAILATIVMPVQYPAFAAGAPGGVPLEDFFRNARFDEVQISPNGRFLSVITRTEKHPEARNIVVMEIGHWDEARLVTDYEDEEVRWHAWAEDDRLVFKVDRDYENVNRGFEYVGLYSVRQDGREGRPLHEPFRDDRRRGRGTRQATNAWGGSAENLIYLDSLPNDPSRVLVGKEDDYFFPDAYRLDVSTGRLELAARAEGHRESWYADSRGRVRAALGRGPVRDDLQYALEARDEEEAPWRIVREFHDEDLQVHGFDRDDRHLWVSSRIGRDRLALYRLDTTTGELGEPDHQDPEYDVSGQSLYARGLIRRKDGTPLLFEYMADRPRRVFLDDGWAELQATIDEALPDTVNSLVDWDDAETRFVVHARSDRQAGAWYLFDREAMSLKFLVAARPWLDAERLQPMEPVRFEARDGLVIHGYLTRAAGDGPAPLIVHPHGGPYGFRDEWGFNPEVQFLASRGYAVLQVNYRGSGGYGRDFETQAYRRWGLEMQDDLTDAVRWAIDEGFADPERVGIYGASYGGYATMMGLVKTPELYRVGISYVGVVDLLADYKVSTRKTYKIRVAGHFDIYDAYWRMLIGDPATEAGRLRDASPIHFVDRIRAPVFVVHGQDDPRVDIDSQFWPLVRELKKHGKTFESMVKRHEGHGFFKEANQVELYTAIEAFLDRYMPAGTRPPGTDERVSHRSPPP